jgi:hypothetical protein
MSETRNNDKWRTDQIAYFREYLKCFDEKTREHTLILEGINELKKSI